MKVEIDIQLKTRNNKAEQTYAEQTLNYTSGEQIGVYYNTKYHYLITLCIFMMQW